MLTLTAAERSEFPPLEVLDLEASICAAKGRADREKRWLLLALADRKMHRAAMQRLSFIAKRIYASTLNDSEDACWFRWRHMHNERRNRDHLILHQARKAMMAAPMRAAE